MKSKIFINIWTVNFKRLQEVELHIIKDLQ